jgi:S-adenosylmethionine synthetase
VIRPSYIFTSESVSEGHPDKVADRISDTVVDAFLTADPYARVACETLVTTQRIVLAGEVRGPEGVVESLEEKVRAAIKDIGYEQDGFHWNTASYECHLHAQSADIAVGVDAAGNKDEGAGDQGIMFGYATNETPELMPATLQYSHNILKRLAEVRHVSTTSGLQPDAKSQVTLLYENGKPIRATSIVLSTQHDKGLSAGEVAEIVRPYILEVLPASSKSAARTGMRASPAARSSSTPTAARRPTAAAPSQAKTPLKSTAPPPTSAATSPKTWSLRAWRTNALSRSATPSASPARSASTSTCTTPAKSIRPNWKRCCPTS